VCMGNICRSPTAEGVFRKVVSDAGLDAHIRVDSAGTHAYHVNEPPDRRAQAAAERRGFVLSNIRARRVIAPEHRRSKISLFLEFAGPGRELEVPDPYYGGAVGFERVLDLVEEASRGLLETLKRESSFG